MKKIFSILTLGAGVALATSCSDFLDQTSPSEQTTETTYNSLYYTELRVNKIYGGLAQDRTYAQDLSITWKMNSDVELVDGLGNNAYNTSSERGNMNYNTDPGWTRLADVWTAMYGVIEDANLTIEGIRGSSLLSTSDSTTMRRYLGEALTLRAMLYFDMIRYWGDIPLKLESSKSDLSNAYLAKTDRDVIMDTLMLDLEEAIKYLPWADQATGYTTEHCTKGYAHGLLAQMAMTRAGYAIREKAKDGYVTASYTDDVYPTMRPGDAERTALLQKALYHWSEIIRSGVHRLNPSFENQWYLVNQLTLDQTYHENIFEIPMGLNYTGELGYTVGVRMNGITAKYGYGNSSGKMKVTAPLLYSYKDNDTRRDITCSPMQIVADEENSSRTIEEMLGNAPFGIYVGKWDPRKMTEEWLAQNLVASAKHTTGINEIKMRYSNVLLYYAECLLELTGSADANYQGDAGLTARQALMQVHQRAYDDEHKSQAAEYVNSLPADRDGFFNALVDENAWEFAGEGFRKYDLIRWNLLVEKIYEFKQTYLRELSDGVYQDSVFFNYKDAAKTQIDMSSITWRGIPEGKTRADYQAAAVSFGHSNPDSGTDTQVNTNLPSISSGLIGEDVNSRGESLEVQNRYLMPIGYTTISAANGYLQNSYGFRSN